MDGQIQKKMQLTQHWLFNFKECSEGVITLKRLLILVVIVLATTVLGACSSKPKSNVPGVKVTNENKSYLEKYDNSLQEYITDMTSILKTLNDALDGIYTKRYSREQFATVISGSIEKSNKLVTKVETLDVNPDLFETHQNLILLVNRSHQLLLDAVDMANTEDREIEKDELRNSLIEIKTEQANITNQWKILRQELSSSNTGKK